MPFDSQHSLRWCISGSVKKEAYTLQWVYLGNQGAKRFYNMIIVIYKI